MTFLRRDPDSSSNWLNRLIGHLGHRGSSFSDIDAVVDDGRTGCVLIIELKRPNEALSAGQKRLLQNLAALSPRITVWYVQRWTDDDRIGWADLRNENSFDVLTHKEFQARYVDWWEQRYFITEDGQYGPAEKVS